MKKKTMLVLSFALSAVLVIGQMAFASTDGSSNMMNGNGMSGMANMMNNENMNNMMNAMNSEKGQEMMNACGSFMESYGDDTAETN